MPELPDAEVFRRRIARNGLHRRIETVRVSDERLLDGISPSTVRRRLKGREMESTRRHGKHVFVELSDGQGWLRLHFGMTGTIRVLKEGDDRPDHVKLQLDLADGRSIAYTNTRTFGRIGLADDVGTFVAEKHLGPDALREVDLPRFRQLMGSGSVKRTLLDQSTLAGLGNVYTDETLFQAGVYPGARADRLRDETVEALYRAMRRVLEKAIEAGADPEAMPEDFLLPNRRKGGACPSCGRGLRTEKIAGRMTYFCPRDQRRRQ